MERLTHIPGIDVCIAHAQKVKSLGEPEEFEKVLLTLNELNPRPQVVGLWGRARVEEGSSPQGCLFLRGPEPQENVPSAKGTPAGQVHE
jgi:hypothetical protein